ncbi:MAG: TlpA family protein disulfide reductase [Phycisphaerae bacterium]|nr:TlpA family protein disulfide reductase [Phycisphaerae bacterium]
MLKLTMRLVVLGFTALCACGGIASASCGDQPADEAATLFPGAAAPAIQVEEFVKGKEVESFTPGRVYVVEFWATWCGPCVERFAHLSEIQRAHGNAITIVGVNIWEEKEYSDKTSTKVREIVKGQGDRMQYSVAYDGAAAKTASAYMQAAQQTGIPTAFIVDQKGRVAWIGHPAVMETPLEAVLKGEFDIENAKAEFEKSMARRAEARKERLAAQPLMQKWSTLWSAGKKDEALPLMAEFVGRWPRFGYDPAYKAINYLLAEKHDSVGARRWADRLIDDV